MHIPPQACDIPSDGFLSEISEYASSYRQIILAAIADALSSPEALPESHLPVVSPIECVDLDIFGETHLIAYRHVSGNQRLLLSFFSYGRSPF